MNRAKIRKAVASLPKNLPAPILERALKNVTNDKTRQRLRARYQRAEGVRTRR